MCSVLWICLHDRQPFNLELPAETVSCWLIHPMRQTRRKASRFVSASNPQWDGDNIWGPVLSELTVIWAIHCVLLSSRHQPLSCFGLPAVSTGAGMLSAHRHCSPKIITTTVMITVSNAGLRCLLLQELWEWKVMFHFLKIVLSFLCKHQKWPIFYLTGSRSVKHPGFWTCAI